jgi:DnaA-like protein
MYVSERALEAHRAHVARMQKWRALSARVRQDPELAITAKKPEEPVIDRRWQTIARGTVTPEMDPTPPTVMALGYWRPDPLRRYPAPAPLSVIDIQRAVCRHFHMDRCNLLAMRRTTNVVFPRQIAMYLAKALTGNSYPEIGRRFGGRHHTTVLHAVRKIEALRLNNSELESMINTIKGSLNVAVD